MPDSPAPTTSAAFVVSRGTHTRWRSWRPRHSARAHAITTSAMNPAATGALRGTQIGPRLTKNSTPATPMVTPPSATISSSVPVRARPWCNPTDQPSTTCSTSAAAAKSRTAPQGTLAESGKRRNAKNANDASQTPASNDVATARRWRRSPLTQLFTCDSLSRDGHHTRRPSVASWGFRANRSFDPR